MNSDTTTRGFPLGEAFSHHLRSFWNPVKALELYSSPDGTQLAVICNDGSVRVIDAQTGSEYCRFIGPRRRTGPLIGDDPLSVKCAAWAPDGLRLAVGYEDGSIRIWGLAFQDEQLCWEWHTNSVTHLAWSPDGQAMASIGDDVALGVWEVSTGEARFIYQGPEQSVKPPQFGYPYHCSWSPSSEYLAVACADQTIRVLTAKTGEEETLLHCESIAETFSWSPVGTCMVMLSNQGAVVWNPFENRFQPLIRLETPLQLIAWSSDGAYIALGTPSWIGMWKWDDLYAGRLDQGQAYYGKNIHSVSWLPDHTLALADTQGITLVSMGLPRNESARAKLGDFSVMRLRDGKSAGAAERKLSFSGKETKEEGATPLTLSQAIRRADAEHLEQCFDHYMSGCGFGPPKYNVVLAAYLAAGETTDFDWDEAANDDYIIQETEHLGWHLDQVVYGPDGLGQVTRLEALLYMNDILRWSFLKIAEWLEKHDPQGRGEVSGRSIETPVTGPKGENMLIPREVLQELIDQAYHVALETHYEDVPEWGIEMPLIRVLRQIKQKFGLEPTNYGLFNGDPQLLLGTPIRQEVKRSPTQFDSGSPDTI